MDLGFGEEKPWALRKPQLTEHGLRPQLFVLWTCRARAWHLTGNSRSLLLLFPVRQEICAQRVLSSSRPCSARSPGLADECSPTKLSPVTVHHGENGLVLQGQKPLQRFSLRELNTKEEHGRNNYSSNQRTVAGLLGWRKQSSLQSQLHITSSHNNPMRGETPWQSWSRVRDDISNEGRSRRRAPSWFSEAIIFWAP